MLDCKTWPRFVRGKFAGIRFFNPAAKRLPAEVAIARDNFKKAAQVLDGALQGQVYLCGAAFSVADIVVTYTLNWAAGYDMLSLTRRRLT